MDIQPTPRQLTQNELQTFSDHAANEARWEALMQTHEVGIDAAAEDYERRYPPKEYKHYDTLQDGVGIDLERYLAYQGTSACIRLGFGGKFSCIAELCRRPDGDICFDEIKPDANKFARFYPELPEQSFDQFGNARPYHGRVYPYDYPIADLLKSPFSATAKPGKIESEGKHSGKIKGVVSVGGILTINGKSVGDIEALTLSVPRPASLVQRLGHSFTPLPEADILQVTPHM